MEGGWAGVVGETDGEQEREAWQTVGEAEASSAVLCAEGALNSLSKGEGERRGGEVRARGRGRGTNGKGVVTGAGGKERRGKGGVREG